ncbi:kinase-like protein, partial [Neolentinus lepideus HHB14362 ss-1]
FREGLHRLLLKLAEETSFLPRSLFLYDVQLLKKVAVDWGGFAEIYQGSYKDKLVALKHCRVSNEAQKRALQSLFGRETLVWRQLRHPHMLPFLGIDSTTFGPQMCLVSPWMENGNATKYRKARTFTTSDIHSLLDEISSGLFYLHSENIVHGDLCGRNILIDDEGHARLADFGLSVLAEATRGAYSSSTPSGSTRWQSPELLDFDLPKFRKTTYSDVWAFGCVCLEICTGRMPFPQIPPNREVMVAVHILSGARPVRPDDEDVIGLTDNLWHLMQKCWETVPTDRIPWQELPQRMTSIRGMP